MFAAILSAEKLLSLGHRVPACFGRYLKAGPQSGHHSLIRRWINIPEHTLAGGGG